MSRFPTAAHLASWAGVCPGHNESAGRVKSTRPRPGNSYLKGALGIASMAAARTNGTFFQARYKRLAVRRGEMKHIFPYREQADVLFNSALVYEHAVLSNYAQRYLLEIDAHDDACLEAYRLLGFLQRIVPVLPDVVPPNSILREFIGDSAFHY